MPSKTDVKATDLLNGRPVLVTGAGGFVGVHLTQVLDTADRGFRRHGGRWLAAALLVAGCAAAPPKAAVTEPVARGTTSGGAAVEYRLQSGDAIDVKFFFAPELNENLTIRPDGRISLQLIGDVAAASLTTPELVDTLRSRYAGILARPEITVIVRKFAAQKVYVAGEVANPGLISYEGPVNLLQALAQAGWVKATSEPRGVLIIRKASDDSPVVRIVDVREALEKPDGAREVVLQPFDIVYVPKSTVAKVGEFVEQYIDKTLLTPISRLAGFSFAYSLNGVKVIQ